MAFDSRQIYYPLLTGLIDLFVLADEVLSCRINLMRDSAKADSVT